MMKKLLIMMCLSVVLASFVNASEQATVNDEEVSLLFVQDAQGVEFQGDTMILIDAKPQVVYFSDRPHRVAGHVPRQEMAEIVNESFTKMNPNAALVVFAEEQNIDVVMTLTKAPRIEGDNLIYEGIKILEGTPPEKGAANALFIDTFGFRKKLKGSIMRDIRRGTRF